MNYPSNTNKDREEAKKNTVVPDKRSKKDVTRVTSKDVIRRKKPLGKRLKEIFVGGDSRSVWGYIVGEVLVPAIKDMLVDSATQGVERMFYGDSRPRGPRPAYSKPRTNYVSYNRYSSPSRKEEPRQFSRKARSQHDFDEIILETRSEAEEVLDRLYEIVNKYEIATVADLYELTGIQGSYVDDQWGWSDLQGSNISRIREGYLINLPKPEAINSYTS